MKKTALFIMTTIMACMGLSQTLEARQKVNTRIVEEKVDQWVVTAYSDSSACNGKWGPVTADGGDRLKWGMIAADWTVLPPGTKVKIEGFGDQIFVVRDKGRLIKGTTIDLYIPNASRKQLYSWGRKKLKVEVLPENSYVAKQIDTTNRSLFERYSFIPPKSDVVHARTPYVVDSNKKNNASSEGTNSSMESQTRTAGTTTMVQRRLQMRN